MISENKSDRTAPGAGVGKPAPTKRSALRGWLNLFRLPNLLTVPGGAFAGFLLTRYPGWGPVPTGWGTVNVTPVVPCAVAALLLYGAGLASNDYFDRDKDRVKRPERPIPSGLVKAWAALAAAIVLAVAGVAVAALAGLTASIIAYALLVAVATYNLGFKESRWIGPLNMGICRGLCLALGAAAAPDLLFRIPVLISAGGMTAYVAAVTFLAAKETNNERIGNSRELPGLLVILWFAALYNFAGPWRGLLAASLIGAILAANWALYCVGPIRSHPTPKVIQKTIGDLIRGLLLIQAALAAVVYPAGVIIAGVLLIGWLVYGPLARRYAPS